ncbi:MAG: glycosyltransferase family 2 protein [Candidatus Sumerlaeia bacterium]|nr:glycosyltransferase family 2 protein [Candidatus Sumerlaeia bacterium]
MTRREVESVTTRSNDHELSVVICTHNPNEMRLRKTLEGLRSQTLPVGDWELVIVDNKSKTPLKGSLDLTWHPNSHIIDEPRVGLTHARLRGYHESTGKVILMVDDDNILAPDYLELVRQEFSQHPRLGALGGKSIPVFESPPPPWINQVTRILACRDLGDQRLEANWKDTRSEGNVYPEFAPIGAGMAVCREGFATYAEALEKDPRRLALDRSGSSLASGGDNDLVMTILEAGWSIVYSPQLTLEHLIPDGRVDPGYLSRLSEAGSRTWVMCLDVHGIRPWQPVRPWQAQLLKVKYFFTHRAWRDVPSRIKWRGSCGLVEGRSRLPS